jgi:GT2 family glycosyltransferase
MIISVILPTYEEPEAVLCALEALDGQTSEEFEVILVDDSAGDVVRDAVWPLKVHFPNLLVWYIRSSPPRVGRFTASRARNIGAANARGKLLVFVDQDVLLAPECLTNYQRAYEKYGDNVVYVGLYHWMRRIEFRPDDVRLAYDELVRAGLGENDQRFPALPMREPGLQGTDHRTQDFGDIDHIVDDAALGAHSGNVAYPRKLFIELGGFDENIKLHGGEDADLGLTAKAFGAKFLLWKDLWGVHRWHDRDQALNAKEVQVNIEYIDRKHGIGQYAEAHKWMDARDWRDERHYRKDTGGVLMQEEGDPTVWVCREGHRLGIPTPQSLRQLGFAPEEILRVPRHGLASYAVEGTVDNG